MRPKIHLSFESLEPDKSSFIQQRLKENLNKLESSLKKDRARVSESNFNFDQNNLHEHEPGIDYGEPMFGTHSSNNKYMSSMKKMVEDADLLTKDYTFGKFQFLSEEPFLFAKNEDLDQKDDPDALFNNIYDNQVVIKTKRKREFVNHEILKSVLMNQIDTKNDKIDKLDLFNRISPIEKPKILEILLNSSKVTDNSLSRFFKQYIINKNENGILDDLNSVYKRAVEVGRLDPSVPSTSQKQLSSFSKEPRDPFSSGQHPNDEFDYPNPNLEAIAETFNENFTQTNQINSYGIWTKLNNLSKLNSRKLPRK